MGRSIPEITLPIRLRRSRRSPMSCGLRREPREDEVVSLHVCFVARKARFVIGFTGRFSIDETGDEIEKNRMRAEYAGCGNQGEIPTAIYSAR
jgi:hypothetical protein